VVKTIIRDMADGEQTKVSRFIEHVFSEHIDPLYCEQGRKEFRRFIDPEAINKRRRENHFLLVAEHPKRRDKIIAAIEVREFTHVCLFFVDTGFQGRGLGRQIFEAALSRCRENGGGQITVNSSPNAVAAYRSLGFRQTEQEKELNGIRFVQMKMRI